jgi:hypothetical protein
LTRHRTYPWTCSTCQTVSVLRSPHPPNPRRAFTTTPPLPKKSSNSNSSSSKQAPKRTTAAATPNTAKSDPLDFSVFEADIKRTLDGLKHDLGRIRAGGLDAEKIENVRVKLGPGGRGEVVRVGEVAQVVQRGRVMVIMVGEGEVGFLFIYLFISGSFLSIPIPIPRAGELFPFTVKIKRRS